MGAGRGGGALSHSQCVCVCHSSQKDRVLEPSRHIQLFTTAPVGAAPLLHVKGMSIK